MSIIFHIDVNSAFLSWTAIKLLKDGAETDIRTIPAIVGGDPKTRHGIVVAKSIPAKKYGIKTAETVASAKNKCPDILIVPPEHHYYHEQSEKLMALLRGYTPNIEQVSIDECYLDYDSIANSFESPEAAAYEMKDTIKEQLGFTVNIGISDVKVLAKMASDFQKPDRVHTLYKKEIREKMWPLPIEDLFMAGRSSVEVLHKLGIFTIGQLAQSPRDVLEAHLKSHGTMLLDFANGIDQSAVEPVREDAKGVGNSVTLPKDYDNLDEIDKILLQLSDKVAGRLRKLHQRAKTIAVEVKFYDFTKASRQTTFEKSVDSGMEIYRSAKKLFRELWQETPVRLLGVRTTNLIRDGEPEQMSLSDLLVEQETSRKKMKQPSGEKIEKLERALDRIKDKYGSNAVQRASSIEKRNDDSNAVQKEDRNER